MRISTNKPAAVRECLGFTLVEMMAVVLIIGLSLGVLFNVDYSASPQRLKNQAKAFSNTAGLILEEAVLSGDDWGIDFYTVEEDKGRRYGYRWLHRQDQQWREDLPVGMDNLPDPVVLDAEFDLQLEIEGLPAAIGDKVDLSDPDRVPADFSPDVWLYPNHESTAFSVVFRNSEHIAVPVAADILGRFQVADR